MAAAQVITLPHGRLGAGSAWREAELHAPTGADEASLLERRAGRSRAELASDLLERCVSRLAGKRPSPAALRALTAGDREALLLHLRAAAFGDRLVCVLECPRCEARMDLVLSVRELLCAPYETVQASHEVTLEAAEQWWRVRFRLPTGADQEAAGRERSVEAGLRVLAERCVEAVTARDSAPTELPDDALDQLSDAMAALDPQAEIRLRVICPECEHSFTSVLDAAAVVISELTSSAEQLLREVHAIALRYHWSERDIFGLDVRRRRAYLDLLVESEQPAGAIA